MVNFTPSPPPPATVAAVAVAVHTPCQFGICLVLLLFFIFVFIFNWIELNWISHKMRAQMAYLCNRYMDICVMLYTRLAMVVKLNLASNTLSCIHLISLIIVKMPRRKPDDKKETFNKCDDYNWISTSLNKKPFSKRVKWVFNSKKNNISHLMVFNGLLNT